MNEPPRPRGLGLVRIVLAEAAVVGLIAVFMIALLRGASSADPDDAGRIMSVPTVVLDDLPAPIAQHYRYAADHAAEFAQIPCFCGCERTLGHTNLTDCFVAPDGGWDAHASGCTVCTIEAATARTQLDAGTPADQVRALIIAKFGPPPSTTSTGV